MSSTTSSPSAASQESHSDAVLTPSKKVQALLAQFDASDSDSVPVQTRRFNLLSGRPELDPRALPPSSQPTANADSDASDGDDDLPTAPRGRLAARLQAEATIWNESGSEKSTSGNANSRKKQSLTKQDGGTEKNSLRLQASSDDELAGPIPRRRLLLKRKSNSTKQVEEIEQRQAASRSPSPLFFPSPSRKSKPVSPAQLDVRCEVGHQPAGITGVNGNSKFLELVEKHRKQRLAKEAAEIAARAVRVDQLKKVGKSSSRARGSSPADGTDEDSGLSDAGARAKLSKQAKLTRKASKKALEEMNRETQRMSRNMQLAHQAKIKKKITKESLLARFNFHIAGTSSLAFLDELNKSTTPSSAHTSDAEGPSQHNTPPTSPLPPHSPNNDEGTLVIPADAILDVNMLARQDDTELPSLDDILTQPPTPRFDKGKGKATYPETDGTAVTQAAGKEDKTVRPIRVKWSKEDAVIARAADSDSDLEIVTSQSKTRKYAAFETLPRGKAKETHSHLMLRGLAHITDSGDKKGSSLNAAEMDARLRHAARMQARKERQEKIEELKARGVVIQTAEERERDQQEVEDLVERARQEASEIQKKEKAKAKKDGTYVKDGMDDDDSDDEEDGDFQDQDDDQVENVSDDENEGEEEADDEDEDEEEGVEDEDEDEEGDAGADDRVEATSNDVGDGFIEHEADEDGSDEASNGKKREEDGFLADNDEVPLQPRVVFRKSRQSRVVDDDDDIEQDDLGHYDVHHDSPVLPAPAKTPQSLPRSARKVIPGLDMSDDLPMGLTQAFAATMAESQDQTRTQEQDSFAISRELPSPGFAMMPHLGRQDSIDMISDSQPPSQTQPLNLDLSFSQSQIVPQSPAMPTPHSQMPFEPTQDAGYMLSPFMGNRFDTPVRPPHSTAETVILPREDDESPVVQRKGKLRRGRIVGASTEADSVHEESTAFEVMQRATRRKEAQQAFDKATSNAKDIVDEAAEESEDEYAGLGGASDDEAVEEDEEDRKMIDHDTQVGVGDEAQLAGLHADRERQQDEAAVSKLLKDITTGALRRKRGAGDDLDLSDEEDEAARRREAKRREFARMRRELLKDEAVGKIAEDRKKDAFLKSIEDREAAEDEDDVDFDQPETREEDSQSQQAPIEATPAELHIANADHKRKRPLELTAADTLNRLPPALRRSTNRKPSTIAEIRESVSFLIEEPDSHVPTPEESSDSEHEPEAYIDLDRHAREADENDDGEDLGDFIVDDSQDFKKPALPASRAPFAERRTRTNVVDRRSLLRQVSSSTAGASGKMAFFTSAAGSGSFKVPSLLRRATTNSSFGSAAGENVSATGVSTTTGTERGAPGQDKEMVRKAGGGRRNAVNYRAKPKEEVMQARVVKSKKGKKGGSGFLGGLFRGDSWA